ncbi:X-linked retinitis pigmentosa GTPase regulator-interacting protein 1 [Borealophlyctis nickersoniae]|nr:X-linked retinitis pigmentosa GTPase regulator-interacting protein 1 [Borealophlyctis nickersoniae]
MTDLPRLRPETVEDELYHLKEDNLELKKRLGAQDDKARKLIAKVQRLTEDLKKARDGPQTAVASRVGGVSAARAISQRRDLQDAYDTMDEFRNQMRNLTKENLQLKNKMNFFRALHEAETRKRTPYDHIPPRINSGVQRRLYPTLAVRQTGKGRARAPATNTSSPPEMVNHSEELEKMEELVNMLRGKLCDTEKELEQAREETRRSQEAQENQQKQDDIDRLSLQRELADSKKRCSDLRAKHDALDEKFRGLTETYEEAVRTVETLGEDLKEERRKNLELEHVSKEAEMQRQSERELNIIIEDLRAEKKLLEEEQARLLRNQFGSEREDEFAHDIRTLKSKIRDLEKQAEEHLKEKSVLQAALVEARETAKTALEEKSKCEAHSYDLQHELDQLRDRMRFFMSNGEIDLSEVEEALTLLRLKKERGLSLDFLMEGDEAYKDKRILQDLRVQYAECVQELDKTNKLLSLQEQINRDYKLEVEDLTRKLAATRNEYELRLEEDSRLLDLRGHKIAQLEAQLKNFAYGTHKVPGEETQGDKDFDETELAKGQNLIEIHIDAGIISTEGQRILHSLGLDNEDPTSITTFVHFDFFEFETQVGPLGVGTKPHWNFTSRFKVFVDDFFLMYLQSQPMVLNLCRSTGLEYVHIATCTVIFKDLTDPHQTNRLRYYGEFVSTHDDKTVIGQIDYSLRVRIPMAQAIQAYKERTVALNLLTVGDVEDSKRRFRFRGNVNNLIVQLGQCKGLKAAFGTTSVSAVYAAFQFYDQEDVFTHTVRGTPNPSFSFQKAIPLPITSDLDRYLRTSNLRLLILDDTSDHVYGVAHIPLLNLALGQIVSGDFELKDERGEGFPRGTVAVYMAWEKAYKLDVTPVVSHLDHPNTAHEFHPTASTPTADRSHNIQPAQADSAEPTPSPSQSTKNAPNVAKLSQGGTSETGGQKSEAGYCKSGAAEEQLHASSVQQGQEQGQSLLQTHEGQMQAMHDDQWSVSSMSSGVSADPRRGGSIGEVVVGSRKGSMIEIPGRHRLIERQRSREMGDMVQSSARYTAEAKQGSETLPSPLTSPPGSSASLGQFVDRFTSDSQQHPPKRTPSVVSSHLSEGGVVEVEEEGEEEMGSEWDDASEGSSAASQILEGVVPRSKEERKGMLGREGVAGRSEAASMRSERGGRLRSAESRITSEPRRAQSSHAVGQPPVQTAAQVASGDGSRSGSLRGSRQTSRESRLQQDVTNLQPLSRQSSRSAISSRASQNLPAPRASYRGSRESLPQETPSGLSSQSISRSASESRSLQGVGLRQLSQESFESAEISSRSHSQSDLSRGEVSMQQGAGSAPGSRQSLKKSGKESNVESAQTVPQRFDDSITTGIAQQAIPVGYDENDGITVSILELHLNLDSPDVRKWLSSVGQLFVSFQFLDYPPEELETHSVPVTGIDRVLKFEYTSFFPMSSSTHSNDRSSLRKLLASSHPSDSRITFIVSEPPPDDSQDDSDVCVDIAAGDVGLLDLLQLEEDGGTFEVPLIDLETEELRVGTLIVSLAGRKTVSTILDEV